MLDRLRSASFGRLARSVRTQPDYPGEVSEDTLRIQRQKVEEAKPADFKLTPISEPGW